MTKNQRTYIKRVRNALRAVKRRLSGKEGNRYVISNDLLPISFDKYNKGVTLTNQEILESAPKRITQKKLKELETKNVLDRLEYFADNGDVISERARANRARLNKKDNTTNNVAPVDDIVRIEKSNPPSESEMMYDKLYSEFSQMNNLGYIVAQKLDYLEKKIGKAELGYAMRDLDEDSFWRFVEQEYYYDDGINNFFQHIIDELPNYVLNEDDKKALKILADNNESI